MRTVQALVMHAVGEPMDVLRLETRPVPEPEAGQVRVRVQAAPIHATDLHILRAGTGSRPSCRRWWGCSASASLTPSATGSRASRSLSV